MNRDMLKQEVHQIGVTDIPDNDLMMTTDSNSIDGKGWYHSLRKFLKLLNIFFQIRATYKLSHVNDNTDVISRSESERRVFLLIWFLGFCLNLGMTVLISILITLIDNDTLNLSNYPLQDDMPVLQKLAVIFGDGATLFLAMNTNQELQIVKMHRFNFDKCGFFAYGNVDHIQTLVGSPGNLNYIHDSNFNSKKIIGNFDIL